MEITNLANIAALLTAIGSLIVAYTSRKKAESEVKGAAVVAYMSLIKPLMDRVKILETELNTERQLRQELEEKVMKLERNNHELLMGVRSLIQQLSGLGTQPIWEPDDEEPDDDT